MTLKISKTGSIVGYRVSCRFVGQDEEHVGVVVCDMAIPPEGFSITSEIQVFFINQHNKIIKADITDLTILDFPKTNEEFNPSQTLC